MKNVADLVLLSSTNERSPTPQTDETQQGVPNCQRSNCKENVFHPKASEPSIDMRAQTHPSVWSHAKQLEILDLAATRKRCVSNCEYLKKCHDFKGSTSATRITYLFFFLFMKQMIQIEAKMLVYLHPRLS